jgi:alanine racemase
MNHSQTAQRPYRETGRPRSLYARAGRPAYLEVDLGLLKDNVAAIRSRLPEATELMAVVKADAYGHGAIACADAAVEAGAGCLGVAIVEEGVQLRTAGNPSPIVVVYPEPPERAPEFLRWNLVATVADLAFAEALQKAAEAEGRPVGVYLKVDTGLGRYGLLPADMPEFLNRLKDYPLLKIVGLFSHFATAGDLDRDYVQQQLQEFKGLIAALKEAGEKLEAVSITNSGAFLDLPETYFSTVRLGILMYGLYPTRFSTPSVPVQPIAQLKTRVLGLKELPESATISYGRTFQTERPTRVATLPIGYADGYPKALSNTGDVLIRGQRAPVLGQVCMDATMVDVTDIKDVAKGDEVVVFGRQGDAEIPVSELAARAGTSVYEILSRLGPRLPRFYVDHGMVVTAEESSPSP